MANGYLGKISAVVSANTGDYVRKLNDSANQTKAFAQTIQQSLKRASSDARKSFQSILTPVQQFERALQNAASLKLSFKGFDGSIRTVEQLQRAISGLTDQKEIDLVVKNSGLSTITEVKTALQGLRQVDLDLFDNIGLEGIRNLRAELGSVDNFVVKTQVKVEASRLDALIQKLTVLDGSRIKKIAIDVEARQLDAALLKERQLLSVAEQINKPLTAAAADFARLTLAVQAGFIPALKASQNEVDAMGEAIDAGAKIGEAEFAKLEARVLKTTAAIGRLSEAQSLVNGLRTGQELNFQQPRLQGELTRASSVQAEASRLTPDQLSANPGISKLVGGVRDLAQRSAEALSYLEQVKEAGADTSAAQAAVGQLTEAFRRQNAELARQVDIIRSQKAVPDGFVDIGFVRSSAVAAKELQRASVEIGASLESVQKSARQVASAQGQARFDLADSLPFIDIGKVNARAVDAKELQRAAVEIGVSIESVQKSARQVSSAQAQTRFDVADALPFIDIGKVNARAVDAKELQRAAVEIGVSLDAVQKSAREVSARQGQARFDLADSLPFVDVSKLRSSAADVSESQRPARQVEDLRSSFNGIQSQIDSLPASISSKFIPAIREANARLLELQAAPDATAEQIDNAAAAVRRLGAAVNSSSRFTQTFAESFNASKIAAAEARYIALRQILLATGVDAGNAAVLIDELREALQGATASGDFGAVEKSIAAVEKRAITAVSAVTKLSEKKISKDLNKVGDISRGGVDKFSLALNQAAFAVDDFFSSTGGLEFKLRAVSNNITQLGFVAGGTTGLLVGLGAVIGGQAALGLLKWANSGRTAEDATKALNEALSRQKTLVEELAEAFRSLGDNIAQKAFSAPAQEAREFAKQLEEIAKKQQEAREGNAVQLDPDVARARADQTVSQRRIDTAVNPATVLAGQRQLEQAKERERVARENVLLRGADPRQAFDAIFRSIEEELALLTNDGGPAAAQIDESRLLLERAQRDQQAAVAAGGNEGIARSLAALQQERERLLSSGSDQVEVQRNVGRIDAIIKALELPFQKAVDNLGVSLLSTANDASIALQDAQQSLIEAISQGIPGAVEIAGQLDAAAAANAAILDRISKAQTITDPTLRRRELDSAQGDLDGGRQARDAARNAANRVRRDSSLSPQQQAVQRAEQLRQNLVSSGLQGSGFATELNRVFTQRQNLIDRATQENLTGQDRQRVAAGLAEKDTEIAALVASTSALSRFTEALAKATDEASRDVGSAQQRVDEARRNELRLRAEPIAAGRDVIEQAVAVRAAEEQALRLQQEAQTRVANAAKLGAEAVQAAAEVSAVLAETNAAAARGRQLLQSPEQQAALGLDAQLRDASAAINEAFGAELAKVPEFIRNRNQINLADGLDLKEIENAVRGGLINDEAKGRVLEQINNIRENAIAAAAPAFAALADARENALLQGPSRAALNVSDISTQQGAAELSRLLRGDDAAKDVNLLELKAQSKSLQTIEKTITELKQRVGVAN